MASSSSDRPEAADPLLDRAAQGDRAAWGELLERHRDRLRRMVAFRIDQRLRQRIDPSDVIQEACIEASARLPEYLEKRPMPFFLWLRFLTGQKLLALHRRHVGAKRRAADREVSIDRGAMPEATSAALAAQLVGGLTRPSEAAVRAEIKARLQEALDRMEPIDREVLALRHFEQLSGAEAAQVLEITEEAAKKRHLRALKRLKGLLTDLPGGIDEVFR